MRVMRGAVALGLCVVLQVGAAVAPLVHSHVATGHSDQPNRIHLHVDGHAAHSHSPDGAGEIAMPDPDAHAGRSTSVPFFLAVDPDLVPVLGLPQVPFAAHVHAITIAHVRVEAPRSHGPPAADRTTPRAPPSAFLI